MQEHTRGLNQQITYWAPGAPDGFGGVGFVAPVTMEGRWEDKSELFRDPHARELMSAAVVYTARPLSVQGFIALGEFADASPLSIGKEIRQTQTTVNVRATRRLSKVFL